jgi:PAS domain S-box-containing protein
MIGDIQNYKVLIVEDNEGDVLLIEEYLNEYNSAHQLIHTRSLKETAETLKQHPNIDVILLDLTLPDGTGEVLIEKVVQIAPTVPIIILTGYTNREFGIHAVNIGVSDYLLKDDLTPYVLIKSISYSVERNRINTSLRRSEYQYRELFDLNPIPMWVYDAKSLKFLNVNEAALNHYGYSRSEFLSLDANQIGPESEPEAFLSANESAMDTTLTFPGRIVKHRKSNGDIIDVEIRTSTIDYNGHKAALVLANDSTEKRIYQENLIRSLKEKETLLAEIHHRVKNNLAIVSGMMQLQSYQDDDEVLRAKLLDSVSRIQTMAAIHEHLYQANSFSKINFPDNLNSLVSNIITTFQSDLQLSLHFECVPVTLNINQAVPSSLIVNEVITNILKHAFKGRTSGEISIILTLKNELLKLRISDNGVGLPDGFTMETDSSLGLLLIRILTEQLAGQSNYSSLDSGTVFELSFELNPELTGSASAML